MYDLNYKIFLRLACATNKSGIHVRLVKNSAIQFTQKFF